MDNFRVFATYQGTEESFSGSVSGSSVTIDLPANIDSWTAVWIRVYLDYGTSIQLNGAGTAYSPSAAEKITGVSLSDLSSIVVKADGCEDKTYTVTVNKKLYVHYNKNTTAYIANWSSLLSDATVFYSAGEKITLPAADAESSTYKFFGWAPTSTAESSEYDAGSEISVTQEMLDSGVFELYAVWSKYYVGEFVTDVTDIEGRTHSGYVAYICGKDDSVKASSSDSGRDWTYLVVSRYGENRLSEVSWYAAVNAFKNAGTGVNGGFSYLSTKSEMLVIIENRWENFASRRWPVFSDGTNTESGWASYWTATEDESDDSKGCYASVTTSYNGSYAGNVSGTQPKDTKMNAIGVAHVK